MAVELDPVYYFYGTEDFLMEKSVAGIKAGALTAGMESLNFHIFQGSSLDASSLIAEAETLPAMSVWRVIWVKGAEALKQKEREALAEYLKAPSPTTCLIFTSNAKKIEQSGEFFKVLKKKGWLKQYKELSERELATWIRKEAERSGKTISGGAAERLIDICGRRLRNVEGELKKIILFVGEREKIEVADVEGVGIDVKERTIFDLTDAVGRKDLAGAFKVFSKVTGEPPLKVLGAVARQVRILLRIKSFEREGVPRGALPKKTGVVSYFLDSYLKSSSAFTENELSQALRKIREADLELKRSGLPPHLVMTRLIMDLCKRDGEGVRA